MKVLCVPELCARNVHTRGTCHEWRTASGCRCCLFPVPDLLRPFPQAFSRRAQFITDGQEVHVLTLPALRCSDLVGDGAQQRVRLRCLVSGKQPRTRRGLRQLHDRDGIRVLVPLSLLALVR